jgi:hypothetical protein
MGQEDARRDCVYWLVEPMDGHCIHGLVRSTHHQGAQALANTHQLSLAALMTPIAWSVATMHTAIVRSAFASCRTRRVRAQLVRRVHRLWCPVLQKHILPRTVVFFKPYSFHQLVGFYPAPPRLLRLSPVLQKAKNIHLMALPFDGTIACTQATNQLRKRLDLAHHLTSKLTAKPRENRERQETPGDKIA